MIECAIDDCQRPVKARGYCKSHHAILRRKGELPRVREHRRHGRGYDPLYRIWLAMMQRCYKESCRTYERYGGRGIQVCDRWHTMENFIADMSPRPEGAQLERIDNDGDYTPDNCKWATVHEQCRNKRNNIWVTHNGETLCAADWDRRLGFPRNTVGRRKRMGWSDEKALMEWRND